MMRFLVAALLAVVAVAPVNPSRADEQEAKAVLDKAIKAIGGEEVLDKAKVITWKIKGSITFGDNDNEFTGQTTAQGLDRSRAEFEGDFNGNTVKGVTVLDGDKGWRKFGDDTMELDDDQVAREKRTLYLQMVPVLLVPLKGPGFKVESAAEEKVGDRPASVLKVTGPDGKDFTISFDKESGLPVKTVATVPGFQGEDFTQESTFADYKDFGGIKKATKLESKRDGERFLEAEVEEFKVLEKVEPETFTEPD
jgi:hypothetical protein